MKYPDDFNTPAFPEGKFFAVSRFMATVVMVVFFIIVCLCGFIFWVKKNQDITPFLVYMGPNNERWTMVAHDNHITEIPAYYALQESVLNRFIKSWFTINDDVWLNNANWSDCSDNRSVCLEDNDNSDIDTCAIYCTSGDLVFKNFKAVVLPIYSELEANEGAVWTVEKVSIRPLTSWKLIKETGGVWQFDTTVKTGVQEIKFTGYATIAYDIRQHPKTMGYYITEFYTYRMN